MFAQSLFSGTLLTLPVFATLGIYVGLNWHHIDTTIVKGQTPIGWQPNLGGGGLTDGSGQPTKFAINTYCQKAIGIDPYPGRYTFNPNTWGDAENSGTLCMNVTFDPKIQKTDNYAALWNVTWGFPRRTSSQPVHAYPNAKLNATLPVQVSNIATLPLDVQWTYAVGNAATTNGNTSVTALNGVQLNANVAVDMFLSSSQSESEDATKATHEVMVWLARYGSDSDPFGAQVTPAVTQTVGGVTFTLYYGQNSAGQYVFTWFSDQTYSFTADLKPFLTGLQNVANGPTASDYLGYYAFGSEAFSVSSGNVTFGVQKLELDVTTS